MALIHIQFEIFVQGRQIVGNGRRGGGQPAPPKPTAGSWLDPAVGVGS